MDPILFFYFSSSDSEEEYKASSIRREIRDKSNPLSLSEFEFKRRFRLSKEAFNYVLSEINFPGHLSTCVPPLLQLAATLNLLASGSYQHNVGNDYLVGIAQSTLCKIVDKLTKEMQRKLCPKHITFSPANSSQCMKSFMQKYGIPGVIGCVDGTHFPLQKPIKDEHTFYSKKGFHSLNSMLICDHEFRILAINSKYGGAAHDSFVWRQSEERHLLQQLYSDGLKNVWILGDAGYPLEPWCIVPYRNPSASSEEAFFNEIHSKARCIAERTIGILKARWKILCHEKRSRYTPEKMALFGNVCAALHNICILFKVPMYIQRFPVETISIELDNEGETELIRIGEKIRDQIKRLLRENS